MKIHKVKSPFMSRIGQFEEGKQTLCIGLDMRALQEYDSFRVFLGEGKKVAYDILSATALGLTEHYHSDWTNKAGRRVAIIPIKDFTRVEL